MQWGPQTGFLRRLQEQTKETPAALLNRPGLKQWNIWYYDAFGILSASRPIGMGGTGAIPLSEIHSYMELFGIDDLDERDTFIKMIRALDSAYLKHVREKAEAERTKKAKPERPFRGAARQPRRSR